MYAGIGQWGGNMKTLRYLDKHERVRFDGFEELTEYIVDQRYEIFVRLVLGERLLITEDCFEQVQCGYLTGFSWRKTRVKRAKKDVTHLKEQTLSLRADRLPMQQTDNTFHLVGRCEFSVTAQVG